MSCCRQFNFSFFRSFFQTLQSKSVTAQINTVVFFELVRQIVNNTLVKVFTTQERITVCGFNFKHAVADFQNRNIECTTTKVINNDCARSFFIHTISQSGCRRFVDNTQNFQSGNFTGVFGSLTLRIIEVSRNCNNSFFYFFTQIALGIFLNFLQNNSRNLRRRIFLAFNFYPSIAIVTRNNFKRTMFLKFFNFSRIITATNQSFNGKQGIFWIGNSLTFCRIADQTFRICESNHRRRCARAFGVFQNFSFFTIHNGKARVCCTEVNTYNFITHNFKSSYFISKNVYREQFLSMQVAVTFF